MKQDKSSPPRQLFPYLKPLVTTPFPSRPFAAGIDNHTPSAGRTRDQQLRRKQESPRPAGSGPKEGSGAPKVLCQVLELSEASKEAALIHQEVWAEAQGPTFPSQWYFNQGVAGKLQERLEAHFPPAPRSHMHHESTCRLCPPNPSGELPANHGRRHILCPSSGHQCAIVCVCQILETQALQTLSLAA